MKKYLIEAGKHYSFHFPMLVWDRNKMEITFKFDETAIYQTQSPNNQNDWNKLFGFSRGFHHNNSVRLVWRWNPNIKRIEITDYYYTNGVRFYNKIPLLSINPGEERTLSISIANRNAFKLGYILFPYFGGQETAPHDIKIMIKYK